MAAVLEAVMSGDTERLTELCNSGMVDVEYRTKNNWTPLCLAAERGDDCSLAILVRNGAMINSISGARAQAAIHIAAFNGYMRCVEILVTANCDVNATAQDGSTALHGAAMKGYGEICDYLLCHGADPSLTRWDGKTAADLKPSCPPRGCETAEPPIRADPRPKPSYPTTTVRHAAKQESARVEQLDFEEPCCQGQHQEVRRLIQQGSNPNVHDGDGWTPLMIACRCGHVECVRELINAGVDVNYVNERHGCSLHLCASFEKLNCGMLLLENGADPDIVDQNGSTALHLVAEKGNDEFLLLLLEHHAALNIVNAFAQTALDLSTSELVTRLLSNAGALHAASVVTADDSAAACDSPELDEGDSESRSDDSSDSDDSSSGGTAPPIPKTLPPVAVLPRSEGVFNYRQFSYKQFDDDDESPLLEAGPADDFPTGDDISEDIVMVDAADAFVDLAEDVQPFCFPSGQPPQGISVPSPVTAPVVISVVPVVPSAPTLAPVTLSVSKATQVEPTTSELMASFGAMNLDIMICAFSKCNSVCGYNPVTHQLYRHCCKEHALADAAAHTATMTTTATTATVPSTVTTATAVIATTATAPTIATTTTATSTATTATAAPAATTAAAASSAAGLLFVPSYTAPPPFVQPPPSSAAPAFIPSTSSPVSMPMYAPSPTTLPYAPPTTAGPASSRSRASTAALPPYPPPSRTQPTQPTQQLIRCRYGSDCRFMQRGHAQHCAQFSHPASRYSMPSAYAPASFTVPVYPSQATVPAPLSTAYQSASPVASATTSNVGGTPLRTQPSRPPSRPAVVPPLPLPPARSNDDGLYSGRSYYSSYSQVPATISARLPTAYQSASPLASVPASAAPLRTYSSRLPSRPPVVVPPLPFPSAGSNDDDVAYSGHSSYSTYSQSHRAGLQPQQQQQRSAAYTDRHPQYKQSPTLSSRQKRDTLAARGSFPTTALPSAKTQITPAVLGHVKLCLLEEDDNQPCAVYMQCVDDDAVPAFAAVLAEYCAEMLEDVRQRSIAVLVSQDTMTLSQKFVEELVERWLRLQAQVAHIISANTAASAAVHQAVLETAVQKAVAISLNQPFGTFDLNELLAHFCDAVTRGKIKITQPAATFNAIAAIVSCVIRKDVFVALFQRQLSKRLLGCKLGDHDLEFAAAFKHDLSTRALRRMIQDVQDVAKYNADLLKHVPAVQALKGGTVLICHGRSWPLQPDSSECALRVPQAIRAAQTEIQRWNSQRTQHQKLQFVPSLGSVVLTCTFSGKKHDIHCNEHQATVLLMFATKTTVSFGEMLRETGTPQQYLSRCVAQLCKPLGKHRILIKSMDDWSPTVTFAFNDKLPSEERVVRIIKVNPPS